MKSRPSEGGSQRPLRVGESIRHALTEILRRAHFRDPDLQGLNVSVTEVRASPDLKSVTAFVLPLAAGAEETKKIVKGLNRASAYLRGEIAREVNLRYAPALRFEADTSYDYAGHIETLLRQHAPMEDSAPEDAGDGHGEN